MVGTGEALLNIRARGGPATDGKGAASVPTAQEFDFQSELQKFDKVPVYKTLYPFWARTRALLSEEAQFRSSFVVFRQT